MEITNLDQTHRYNYSNNHNIRKKRKFEEPLDPNSPKSQKKDLSTPQKIDNINISTLISLDLSGSSLKMIPDAIGEATDLESLNLSYNRLDNLPDSLGCLYNLNILNVGHNNLSSLPKSVYDLFIRILCINH